MQLAKIVGLGVVLTLGGLLSGGPIVWNLNNVLFDDGTAVTGSFTFDADTTTFSALSLTTSGGTSVPATSSWAFLPGAGFDTPGISGFQAVDALSADETGAHNLSLFVIDGSVMTNAGGTLNLGFLRADTCLDSGCSSADSSKPSSLDGTGQFMSGAGVPEPGSWVLSGSALLLAVIGRRRFARG